MEIGEISLLIFVGLVLTVVIALGNYQLYCTIFFDERLVSSSMTNKVWFRGLIVPFIYLPVLNVIGLFILLYMRAIKALDIN